MRHQQNGPNRDYSAEELANFAKHRERRIEQRPECCNRGPACWVELGPPAMQGAGKRCRGCGGVPVTLIDRHRPRGRWGGTL